MERTRAIVAHRAREYETIYILRPNAGEEAADKVSSRISEIFEREQGKLVQVEVWGRRRLAYKIKGNAKGVFVYLKYLGYPGLVEELERNMRMSDAVLKYQTVKLEDEIDPKTVEVDPEAIKFAGIDFSEEVEDEPVEEPDDDEKHKHDLDGDYGFDDVYDDTLAPLSSRNGSSDDDEEPEDAAGEDVDGAVDRSDHRKEED
jgi:small subunit ribosomal protein S6